jgi:hypothetical protein
VGGVRGGQRHAGDQQDENRAGVADGHWGCGVIMPAGVCHW